MGIRRGHVNARHRILNATENLLSEAKVLNVTLEDIASRANVTKGGLLYHFPSKSAVIQAMALRNIGKLEQDLMNILADSQQDKNYKIRAYLKAVIRNQKKNGIRSTFFAALIEPDLVKLIEKLQKKQFRQLFDNTQNLEHAAILARVIDGVFLHSIIGISLFNNTRMERMMDELTNIVRLE